MVAPGSNSELPKNTWSAAVDASAQWAAVSTVRGPISVAEQRPPSPPSTR